MLKKTSFIRPNGLEKLDSVMCIFAIDTFSQLAVNVFFFLYILSENQHRCLLRTKAWQLT